MLKLAPFDLFRFTLNALVGYIAFTESPSFEAVILVALLCLIMTLRGAFKRAT
jgi:hypothetical protein